ncbi:3-deoxy-7-phosphoheptulonate synthase [PVC group bacterium]|nr:3-deoxy-7-phosphoheptulonate synthase [PVC group bacterium]
MIIVMKPKASQEQLDHLIEKIKSLGFSVNISKGKERTVIGVIGEEDKLRVQPLEAFPGVEKVMSVLKPYKLISREFHPENAIIDINGARFGSTDICMIAGPCSVESLEQIRTVAAAIKKLGGKLIRGGAFKPRTSPYAFQGLGEQGLKYLAQIREEFGLAIVTEVMDTRDVELVGKYADAFQIGARNMQNFNLLKEVGATKKPVFLKRGLSATYKEFLMSAEYIASRGNFNVILVERGIRTFEDYTRNTLDITAVPVLKQFTYLPVVIDPSHAAGRRELLEPLSKAAVAVGADGLMLEVHPCPEEALSDGQQQIVPERYKEILESLQSIANAVGRKIV